MRQVLSGLLGNKEVEHQLSVQTDALRRTTNSSQIRIIHLASLIDVMTYDLLILMASTLFGSNREQPVPPGLVNTTLVPNRTRYCVCHFSFFLPCCRLSVFLCAAAFQPTYFHCFSPPQQLLYTFDKQVCVSSCSLNKEETLLGEPAHQSADAVCNIWSLTSNQL